ncbi:MAG: hypothetical protein IJW62_05805 [Clostridia bacterium]|nr:hypothetical protein [Clostridia bacterium]
MLQFFFEIIVAVLAVYGGYTALHELAALLCKWIGAPRYTVGADAEQSGKEDSEDGRTKGSDHAGGDD